MADTDAQLAPPTARKNLLQTLEIDMRMLGMLAAFIILCVGFNMVTGGRFLTPRNIFNLSIQTVSVAIMATGMVFIIVTRHIDLSVGAVLATCSAVMAMVQTSILPDMLGLGLGHPLIPWITIIVGMLVGTLIGAFHGFMIGYLMIPAFIVTLGGLLVWRNVAWYLTDGKTIGPLDTGFSKFGGINGTLGETGSWIVAAIAVVATLYGIWASRRNKIKHEMDVKPVWAEAVLAAVASGAIIGFVAIVNAYEIPTRRLQRMFERRGEVMPEGYTEAYGIPFSVLLLVAIVIIMTIIAKRTRFGRLGFAAPITLFCREEKAGWTLQTA